MFKRYENVIITAMLLGLFLLACFAPDLYIPSYVQP